MIVYIAGKMTGLEDLGRAAFRKAQRELEKAGHVVLNPAVLPDGLAPDAYMPICMAMLNAAEAIYLLDNWEDSQGAQIEEAYAKYQHKLVMTETLFRAKQKVTRKAIRETRKQMKRSILDLLQNGWHIRVGDDET